MRQTGELVLALLPMNGARSRILRRRSQSALYSSCWNPLFFKTCAKHGSTRITTRILARKLRDGTTKTKITHALPASHSVVIRLARDGFYAATITLNFPDGEEDAPRRASSRCNSMRSVVDSGALLEPRRYSAVGSAIVYIANTVWAFACHGERSLAFRRS